ncbi:MAG TPA: hypothetical protein VHK69_15825 [Chitinophagaceae bacterium]|nr:hypothetical protein [Chitinophagaceae bacterium]
MFQFRNTGSGPLDILIATAPPWPTDRVEAVPATGKWTAGGVPAA